MSRPQHQKVLRLRLAAAALGFGAAIAVAGCGTGQVTQTDTQVAAVNGASGTVGDIAVRDAQFTFPTEQPYYPKGSSAPVEVVIANGGSMSDKLVRVSSPYAESVEFSGATTLPASSAVHAHGDAQDNAAVADGSGTGQQEIEITVRNLNREIGPGVTVPVEFLFEKSGAVTVQVPIGPDPSPRQEGGGHGSESGGHH